MADGESTGPSRESLTGFLIGLVAGLAVLGLVWATVATMQDDSAEAPSQAVRTGADRPETLAESTVAPDPTVLQRCTRSSSDISETMRAAKPTLDQWRVHVGAMNQLVVGAITLDQATAFWEDTRVQARRHVREFQRSLATLQGFGLDCPPPDFAPTDEEGAVPCARRVAAQLQAVRLARTSVNTWGQHVKHMNMLRAGTLSPDDATQMWISMWEQGVADLDAYRAAARTARLAQGC
jgi:hypothetical protein